MVGLAKSSRVPVGPWRVTESRGARLHDTSVSLRAAVVWHCHRVVGLMAGVVGPKSRGARFAQRPSMPRCYWGLTLVAIESWGSWSGSWDPRVKGFL